MPMIKYCPLLGVAYVTRKGEMRFVTLNISIEIRYALIYAILMSLCS